VIENVLVVHGVANRDERVFNEAVQGLGARINARAPAATRYNLVPAYWGDLAGGDGANLHDALPPSILSGVFGVRGEADADALLEHIYRAPRKVEGYAVRSQDDAAQVIADAARTRTQKDIPAGTYQTRGAGGVDDAELKQAIEDALRDSTYLRTIRDPDMLRGVGEVVGASLSSSSDATIETRSIVGSIRDTVTRVVGAIDNLLGSVTSEALGALNQAVRGALSTATALSFGDIVAYRDTDNGAAIRKRVLDRAHAGGIDTSKPIVVLAHSLGGLVVLDLLMKGELAAKRLVTFGSQPAMFHVLKQLGIIDSYSPGHSSRVPASIQSWINLWHPMDPLAFVASPVFALSNGNAPKDVQIDTALSMIVGDKLWMHSAYWESNELVDAVLK